VPTDQISTALNAPPTTRGRTTIADRVVAKIASMAALEVEHTTETSSRLSDGRPKATAVVDGSLTRISLDITIEYPAPIRSVSQAVRERVADRVLALADIEAKEVDITVLALRVAPLHTSRVQ
jgi:uncharacterized alkaline shock family protein YloU